ncbi:unnamed protein product, partial [Meganyctiphanes norvegica]
YQNIFFCEKCAAFGHTNICTVIETKCYPSCRNGRIISLFFPQGKKHLFCFDLSILYPERGTIEYCPYMVFTGLNTTTNNATLRHFMTMNMFLYFVISLSLFISFSISLSLGLLIIFLYFFCYLTFSIFLYIS